MCLMKCFYELSMSCVNSNLTLLCPKGSGWSYWVHRALLELLEFVWLFFNSWKEIPFSIKCFVSSAKTYHKYVHGSLLTIYAWKWSVQAICTLPFDWAMSNFSVKLYNIKVGYLDAIVVLFQVAYNNLSNLLPSRC